MSVQPASSFEDKHKILYFGGVPTLYTIFRNFNFAMIFTHKLRSRVQFSYFILNSVSCHECKYELTTHEAFVCVFPLSLNPRLVRCFAERWQANWLRPQGSSKESLQPEDSPPDSVDACQYNRAELTFKISFGQVYSGPIHISTLKRNR